MSFRFLKASISNLIGHNSGQLFDAMLRAIMSTTKLITKNLQCKLLSDIKRHGIGTNDVEFMLKKIKISDNAKSKLRNMMMNVKLKDAYQKKFHQRRENYRTWRLCKSVIPGHFLRGYLDIQKRHSEEFRRDVVNRHSQKLSHLKSKWIKTFVVPDNLRGIDLQPDMNTLPAEFSSQPRLYGGIQLDEEEKIALELPVKFGLYRKVNIAQSKIDTEEALNKLRWCRIINSQNGEGGARGKGLLWEVGKTSLLREVGLREVGHRV